MQHASRKAATMTPMLSAEWQASHDPDSGEEPAEDLRFRYDGTFVANTNIVGKWRTIKVVETIDDFDPKAKNNPDRPLVRGIELRADGSTGTASFLWSGNTLMDLDRSQALEIIPKPIDNADYLFIESGGFGTKNPICWKPQVMVLKRQ